MPADITATPDRQLADWLFYDDVRVAELAEVDGLYCPDEVDDEHDREACGFCAAAEAHRAERAAIVAEVERREALGLFVDDPDEPTFEERHEPYGIEWQLEQRERAEGR